MGLLRRSSSIDTWSIVVNRLLGLSRIFLSGVFACFLVFLFFLLNTQFLSPVLAQEGGLLPDETLEDNPKTRPVTISAIVPVQASPPAPILIHPEDNALLNNGQVTFRWKVQDHVAPYKKQELILNGQTVIFDISMSNQQTPQYTLTVNDKNEYTLVLKSGAALSDGDYTWKVRVIDVNNRSTDSTTWFFTIDSQAPQLLITQIEQYETAISSSDPTTVPDDPYVVQTKVPKVSGKTESGATVQLTIVFRDGSTAVLITQTDTSGLFSFTLPPLVRGELVELRFTAIDAAGNTSALAGIFVVYQPTVISFPLLPPFLLPEVPIIEIPLDLPVITIPKIPLPPEIEKPVQEIQEGIEVSRNYLAELALYLPWGTLLLFLSYILLLFLLTGSPFLYGGLFAGQLFRAWIFGWKRHQHIWRDERTQQAIPCLGFQVQRTTVEDSAVDNGVSADASADPDQRAQQHPANKPVRTERRISSLFGEWDTPVRPQWVHSVLVNSRAWIFPTSGRLSDIWAQVRELWLYGESFTWVQKTDAPTSSKTATSANTKAGKPVWRTTDACFVLPEDLEHFRFVAWAKRKPRWFPVWFRFVPRVLLFLAVVIAALIVLLSPHIWNLLWFVFLLLVVFRDFSWNVPEKWRIHLQKTPQESPPHAA